MKIIYNGREIPEAYAKFLEDKGVAHVARSRGEIAIMEPGPSDAWELAHQH